MNPIYTIENWEDQITQLQCLRDQKIDDLPFLLSKLDSSVKKIIKRVLLLTLSFKI